MNMLLPIMYYVTPLHNTVLSISNTRLPAFVTDSESCCCWCWCLGSPVGVVIGLQNWGFPTGLTDLSLHQTLQPGYRDQALLPRWQRDQCMKLTTQLHLVPQLRISGAIPTFPPYTFIRAPGILFYFTPEKWWYNSVASLQQIVRKKAIFVTNGRPWMFYSHFGGQETSCTLTAWKFIAPYTKSDC